MGPFFFNLKKNLTRIREYNNLLVSVFVTSSYVSRWVQTDPSLQVNWKIAKYVPLLVIDQYYIACIGELIIDLLSSRAVMNISLGMWSYLEVKSGGGEGVRQK